MALFIVTAGCLVAFTVAGAPGPPLQQATFPGVPGFMFITHGTSAVLIVKVARTTTRRMFRWSDRQHLGGVGVVWALFSTLGAFLLWREWQKLTWP
jgi:hypothetical protein